MQVSTCWTEELDLGRSLECLRDVAIRLAPRTGPASSIMESYVTNNDYLSLIELTPNYRGDFSVQELIAYRQMQALFSKLEHLDIGIDKEAAAFEKFQESEDQCRKTDLVFYSLPSLHTLFEGADNLVLYKARSIVRKVLGRLPNWEEIHCYFGPGATTTIKRRDAYPLKKMSETIACSYELYRSPYLNQILREIPHWTAAQESSSWSIDDDSFVVEKIELNLQEGMLEFVPKNAKTYRCIDKQPTLNAFAQAGLGRYIFTRLQHAGLDLTQDSLNKSLARKGSLDGSLATIDLSSASDTISRSLVKFLLPLDWFEMLSAVTPRSTSYKGRSIDLARFSSMGNGFTFPLESLIFWSLGLATKSIFGHEGDVTVFGDDIIYPSAGYGDITRILQKCGFSVNDKKSFSEGPFRESCGGDYFNGFNIRPHYQKHLVSGQSLFVMHNFFKRNYDDELCEVILSYIPHELRLWGPDGYGDGHLIENLFLPYRTKKIIRQGWGGGFFDTYQLRGSSLRTPYPGDWVTPLYHIYVGGSPDRPVPVTRDGFPCWPVKPDGFNKEYRKMQIYTLKR